MYPRRLVGIWISIAIMWSHFADLQHFFRTPARKGLP